MSLDPRVWSFLDFEEHAPAVTHGVHPVIGYRLCRVDEDDDGDLWLTGFGLGRDYRWLPGTNTAQCSTQSRRHRPPAKQCHCGLYACVDLAGLVKTLGPASDADVVLVGVVGGGKVRIFEHGWRAERAQIVAVCSGLPGRLVVDGHGHVVQQMEREGIDKHEIKRLAQRYKVPAVPFRRLERVVTQWT